MIKRYTASADTTITNAYKANLTSRGVSGNMGESDILEIFSIYGQVTTSSLELSRVLINFPISDIEQDRTSGIIPAQNSCSFYLRMFNAKHGQTLPTNYYLNVNPVSASWNEGHGLDMEDYSDIDYASWNNRVSGSAWTNPGGDFYSSPEISQYFEKGTEDLEVDITEIVESQINNSLPRAGFMVKLSSSAENDIRSYYTKRFFARGTQYFFQRPLIEVRWNDSKKDNRGNFYASSSLASSTDNTMNLFFYNYIDGQLKNIPVIGTGSIYLQCFTSGSGGTSVTNIITGSWVQSGTYYASFSCSTTASYIYDRWFSNALATTCIYTGSAITVIQRNPNEWNPEEKYTTKIINLKPYYSRQENACFRVFTRNKNWTPNVYVVYNSTIRPTIIEDGYWSIKRVEDDISIVDFGTGSIQYTKMSYDISGSYFDFDIKNLESGYTYQINFAYYINNKYEIQTENFKFKVTE